MNKEEKSLLLKDLCVRLPYGVKATTTSNGWNGTYTITGYSNDRIYLDCPVYDKGDDEWLVEFVKPYLRPMSSMTEEEKEHLQSLHNIISDENYEDGYSPAAWETISNFNDYCHEHHLDNRGLIGKGLALEAPEGMYNTKTE